LPGLVAVALVPLLGGEALAWGSRTHEIINRRAAESMTDAAATAWRPLARSLGAHASDADHRKSTNREEPPRHYIDIDVYDEPPFANVPRSLEVLLEKRGKAEVDQWGIVPWAIEECYRMLVLSLERGDWASAGAWAADLGHYVADSHQPLHCTVNYDGQNTGNDGIHLRFEVHMMNRHFEEQTIEPVRDLPDPEGDPVEFCFAWIAEAYPELGTILTADDRARAADPDYGDQYYEVLWRDTQAVAIAQVSRAVRDLTALYAAAWEEAGRPSGPEAPPPFRALSREELVPEASSGRATPRTVWIVAGAVLLGAFLLGG
jgi:hypothetical protein